MRVAAYIRVSTDEQAEQGISIPAQKSRLAAYCQAQGWDFYSFYVDDGYSGKNLDRPAVHCLLEDARAGLFDILLVFKLDRLSRRQRDVLFILEDVLDPGRIGFKSATEPFDTTTAFGKAALGMMAVFAQLERETIIERVKMAKRESARQGRFPGGTPPFGYTYSPETKEMVVDEVRADTVRWIYRRYLSGSAGYQSIAAELEAREVPGPTGSTWRRQTVRKMLLNPVYAGLMSHQGTLYTGRHEAIISRQIWERARSLALGRKIVKAPPRTGEALLSGIIYCGECGARMRVKNTWQNYPCTSPKKIVSYYVCYSQDRSARHMSKSPDCRCGYKQSSLIDREVAGQLLCTPLDEAGIRAAAADLLEESCTVKDTRRAIDQAIKELSHIEKSINRWYTAYEKGALNSGDLVLRVGDLNSRKKHLQEQLDRWEKEVREEELLQVTATELAEDMRHFQEIWAEATPEERKAIVSSLIIAVKVYKDSRVEVSYHQSATRLPVDGL
ncbi:MAG TPA: hypothetical protein DEF36_17010 [Desulfotomaculum sp.]|nr:hypothetical protein [Desulfotomaculum sp.]